MRAVQLDFADRRFPASLVDVPEPVLPGPDWARVRVDTGGICGSDLHIFTANIQPSPTIVGFTPFPFLPGHEIGGTVIESGDAAGIDTGTRVVVQPTITCIARGIDPPCPPCARGAMSACQRLDSQVVTPGMAIGFTTGLGGGWAEQVLAHRSMLFELPAGVPDRAASLHEPLSIASHGVLRAPPEEGVPIAVVGAGIIGLATLAACRVMFPTNPVTVIARHPHQERAARACGAAHVVRAGDGAGHFEELASISDSRVIGTTGDAMLAEGFPFVVDAVGSTSAVNDALRMTDHRGTVVLLGASAVATYDLTAIWWRELTVVGAINHSHDPGRGGAAARHSEERAIDILAAGALPDDVVVTHEFALEDYREAIQTAADRAAGAIKVVFRPNEAR
jgi:threonine dehydrogenase-like Zn-dependent dehydrogenase